jgi:uncharacterized repeat protein (TIGR02059 family)
MASYAHRRDWFKWPAGGDIDASNPFTKTRTVNGTSLVLTFDDLLDTNKPANSAWVISVAGTPVPFTSYVISGATVTFTLSTAATAGQAVTVSYVPPRQNYLRDTSGNKVLAFGPVAVTNNTP